MTAVIICALGALVGLVVALVAGRVVLPFVLRSQEQHGATKLPGPLGDAQNLRNVTIFVYRFVMPITFASVFGVAAYYMLVGETR